MGYSIHDSDTGLPLRLCLTARYDGAECSASFQPAFWRCDPSSGQRRYEVLGQTGITTFYPWYEIILPGYDDVRTVEAKLSHYVKVQQAQDALYRAQRELKELTR